MMASRRALWHHARAAFFGFVLMLPLVQITAPGLLALSAESDVWCRTLSPNEGGSSDTRHSGQGSDSCLVCVAAAIGGSSATPSSPVMPAPRAEARATLPVSLAGLLQTLDETRPPIRAPPCPAVNDRSPAARAMGCALT